MDDHTVLPCTESSVRTVECGMVDSPRVSPAQAKFVIPVRPNHGSSLSNTAMFTRRHCCSTAYSRIGFFRSSSASEKIPKYIIQFDKY